MTVLFEENLSNMPGKNSEALLAEGKEIAIQLTDAEAQQNVLKERDLPQALARFYEEKGTLYLALKAINDAGHELYADNPPEAARFNLHILYRRSNRRQAATEPSEA